MPIVSEPYWFAKCDGCGDVADYDEFSAWKDPGQAADMTRECGWTQEGETWHCPACPKLGADPED